MNTVFTINFRREAYLQEIARTRRRVLALGLWVSYFGVIAVVLGLYGMNCLSLGHRVRQLERQSERMRELQGTQSDWRVGSADLALVERSLANPARWRDRLVRIARLLPPDSRLSSLTVNPDNLSGPADQNKLVLEGEMRVAPAQERMAGVTQLVSALRRDSLFVIGYQNIRLVNARVSQGSSTLTHFVIECR